jgi:hypothetical protein
MQAPLIKNSNKKSLPMTLRYVICLVILTFAVGCTSGPELRINRDPNTDMAAFRTFGFMQDLGTNSRGSLTMLSARLTAATTRELEGRGLQFVSNNPDILINFFSGLQTGIDTVNQPITIMPVRNYGSWAGYSPSFRTGQHITEGTLGVHVIERRTNLLVWEGIARDRVTESMRDNPDETINSLISTIFAEFPR